MPRTKNRGVVRVSLADQVTEAVRDMILIGEFQPGQHLTHDDLANRLGVSTMPVREALLRLTHEGFVLAHPSRYFQVAPTTRSDIDDIFWAHATLAGELTARACRNADEDFVDELTAVQDEWEALNGDTAELEALNHRFHRLINLRAASPKLILLLKNTVRMIPERFYALIPEWRQLSTVGHSGIVDAVRSGDEEAARVAARDHVLEAGSLLAKHFTDRGHWTEPGSE